MVTMAIVSNIEFMATMVIMVTMDTMINMTTLWLLLMDMVTTSSMIIMATINYYGLYCGHSGYDHTMATIANYCLI